MSAPQTQILSTEDPQAVSLARAALDRGELIVFPTDTLYGLAGRIQEESLQKIYAAKQRPEEKAIPVLVANPEQLVGLTCPIRTEVGALMRAHWPGALTLVVPKKAGLPASLSHSPGLAVRMPDHPFALILLEQTGPLAVTSANISGQSNPTTAEEVYAQLNGRVSLILDGGRHPGGQASTIVDCQGETPVLLREGAIPFDKILKEWKVT
ncbi:MAG: L-threonylcarbamoyladenylate synthase [Anaerolineaceae bacterium]|nr:L-threonylcarbamoyladenylate synthase [Anaerolineaceae bacterium]